MKQVSVIGSGNVGANCAFFIAENRAASVLLVDVKQGLATGKALDMSEAGPIRHYDTAIRGSDDIGAIRGSDVVVIAAGRVRKPGESREDLLRIQNQRRLLTALVLHEVLHTLGLRKDRPSSVAITERVLAQCF